MAAKIKYNKGVLIAFGELFLKSEGVKKLFQEKLINNLRFFFLKKREWILKFIFFMIGFL